MQAATAALPWDRTLTATQDMLIGTVAPAAIGLAFSGAGILYTLGGYDIEAGRLFDRESAAVSRPLSFTC